MERVALEGTQAHTPLSLSLSLLGKGSNPYPPVAMRFFVWLFGLATRREGRKGGEGTSHMDGAEVLGLQSRCQLNLQRWLGQR